MTEPGLGGALREALERVVESLQGILEIGKRDMSNPKYDGYFETARNALANYRALSLSSPTEPCEHDKTDLGHVHTIAEQASSEIREALERWVSAWEQGDFFSANGNAETFLNKQAREHRRLLAPSRQGAAKRVEG